MKLSSLVHYSNDRGDIFVFQADKVGPNPRQRADTLGEARKDVAV